VWLLLLAVVVGGCDDLIWTKPLSLCGVHWWEGVVVVVVVVVVVCMCVCVCGGLRESEREREREGGWELRL